MDKQNTPLVRNANQNEQHTKKKNCKHRQYKLNQDDNHTLLPWSHLKVNRLPTPNLCYDPTSVYTMRNLRKRTTTVQAMPSPTMCVHGNSMTRALARTLPGAFENLTFGASPNRNSTIYMNCSNSMAKRCVHHQHSANCKMSSHAFCTCECGNHPNAFACDTRLICEQRNK